MGVGAWPVRAPQDELSGLGSVASSGPRWGGKNSLI